MRNESGKKGNNTFYVSDGTELFAENAKIFLQSDVVDNVYQAIVS
jgi:hypothetical protein